MITQRGGSLDTRRSAREAAEVRFDLPEVADGPGMWDLVRDCGGLDPNSSYLYLMWCRDFAHTSIVARGDSGHLLGFITGFRRPTSPGALFVWQVAVAPGHRRGGLAARMLDGLVERMTLTGSGPVSAVEASVTPHNCASAALFGSFALRHDAQLRRVPLFEESNFPDEHDAEELFHIDLGR